MTTTGRSRSRPVGPSTSRQPQPNRRTVSNNPQGIKIRYFSFINSMEEKVNIKRQLLDSVISNQQIRCQNQHQY